MIAAVRKAPPSPYWWAVLGMAAAVAYPFTALPVFAAAHLPWSAEQVFLFSLAAIVVLAFPAGGLWLLVQTAGESNQRALVRRGLGTLLIIAPVMRILSGVLASRMGIPNGGALVWYSLWAAIAAVMLWRTLKPEPPFPAGLMAKAKSAHWMSAMVIGLFVVAHLATSLTILQSPEAYNRSASLLRLAYRTPVAEPILIGLLILQVITGLAMALEAFTRRASVEYLIQLATGMYLAVFLGSHTTAVAVGGRQLLNQGPDFTFASAGVGGLLASPAGAALAPYYFLAVVAFFSHLARPLRLGVMRFAGGATARRCSYALTGVGIVVASALLIGLCTPMITTHSAHHFPADQTVTRPAR
ncbi:MAG: hypothetical protein IT160_08535 [Bryobacterales bacterium]|nr:hypothetical protein [Bryobacterales bacterium]